MKINVYTKPNCAHCTQAKALLDSRSLSYSSYSLDESEGEHTITREQLLAKFPSARTMPQIEIDGVAIGGLSELKTFLNQSNV